MKQELKQKLLEEHVGKKLAVVKVKNPDPAVEEKIEVVVSTPSRIAWKRFNDELKNDKLSARAADNLISSCLVHPSKDEFRMLEEQFPGIVSTISNKLVELAAVELDAEVEHLS